jgi:quinolinate synthase
MKKITLEKIASCLERMEPRVVVPEQVASRARRALERMVAIAP